MTEQENAPAWIERVLLTYRTACEVGAEDFAVVTEEVGAVIAELLRLQGRVAQLEADRARFTNDELHWAVRLSRGTLLEFYYDEETARQQAATYRAALLVCDVRSTDWREAGPCQAAPAGAEGGV